ncbi:MAG: response regulator transcription factor, partial [Dehalococcoidales bacterium]|nr:response regulator transcription factor [Dehalococcoidales bacterium]
MEKINIFVVEDHQLFRKGLVNVLNQFPDLEVIGEAATIRDAMENIQRLRPKIVIMDVFLPDGDGVEAASEIRRRFPEVDVIILTISDDIEILNRAVRAGAKGYLVKGNGLREIVETIRLV